MRRSPVPRPSRLPLLVVAVLVTAACGTTVARDQAATPPTPATEPTTEASPEIGCDGEPLPARRASLVALDEDGSTRFDVPLPEPRGDDSTQAPPVEDDRHVYLVAGGAARALDREDGEQVWQVPVDGPLYGMWLEGGRLVMVLHQVGGAHAVALDPRSGEQLWRYDVPERGLLGMQELTGDDGLAWIAAGRTEVLDLATGRVRWAAAGPGQDAALAAGSGLVLRGVDRGVTAYDAGTGEVRWRAEGLSDMLALDVVGDVVLVSQAGSGVGLDGSVDAFRLSTGERLWEVAEDEPLAVGGASTAGAVLYTQSSGTPTFRLVDLATGRTRWSARTQIALALPAVVREDVVVTVEGGTSIQPDTAVVARRGADGSTAWSVPLPDGNQPPLPLGEDAVVVLVTAGQDQAARVLDVATGEQRAQVPLDGYVQRPTGSLLQVADPAYGCALSGPARGPATPSTPPAP